MHGSRPPPRVPPPHARAGFARLQTSSLVPQFSTRQDPSSNAAPSRSPYEGQPITHPESLSGVWEASDGRGGVLGIDLQLQTSLRGKALPPLHGETLQSLDRGIFETSSPSPLFGEELFGDVQPDAVQHDSHRLVLHTNTSDLELTLEPDGNWTGRFHRGDLDRTVTLVQIAPRAGRHRGLLGTWRSGSAALYTCLHIAEPVSGSITAWQDQHQNNDVMRFAPQIPRPAFSFERYGSRFSVRLAADRGLILENPSLASCCAYSSIASLHRGVLTLTPTPDSMSPWSLNGAHWQRMPGNTCAPPPPVIDRDPPCRLASATKHRTTFRYK